MNYEFKPMFDEQEEEAMGQMSDAVKLLHAVARLQFEAARTKTTLNYEALIHNLSGELEGAASVETELLMTFPTERSEEQRKAARALDRCKRALRLAQAAQAFVRVYEEVSRP